MQSCEGVWKKQNCLAEATAVTTYISREQLLLFAFAGQRRYLHSLLGWGSSAGSSAGSFAGSSADSFADSSVRSFADSSGRSSEDSCPSAGSSAGSFADSSGGSFAGSSAGSFAGSFEGSFAGSFAGSPGGCSRRGPAVSPGPCVASSCNLAAYRTGSVHCREAPLASALARTSPVTSWAAGPGCTPLFGRAHTAAVLQVQTAVPVRTKEDEKKTPTTVSTKDKTQRPWSRYTAKSHAWPPNTLSDTSIIYKNILVLFRKNMTKESKQIL